MTAPGTPRAFPGGRAGTGAPTRLVALTEPEREFLIWALGYVQGAALRPELALGDSIGRKAAALAEKLKDPA
jgi:hypothetical protein